jgi:hypothetical protein
VTTERLTIKGNSSAEAKLGSLIVSVADGDDPIEIDLVVGRVGYPNVEKTLRAGGGDLV